MCHKLKIVFILGLLVACSTEINLPASDPALRPSPDASVEASPMPSQNEPIVKPSPSPEVIPRVSLELKLVTSEKQAPVSQVQVKLTDIEKTEITRRTGTQGNVLFSGLKPGLIRVEVLSEALAFESKELVLESDQQLTLVGQEIMSVPVETPMPVVSSTPKPVLSATPAPVKTPVPVKTPTVQVPIFLNPVVGQPSTSTPSPSASPTLPQEYQIQKVTFKVLSSPIETIDTQRYLTLNIGLEVFGLSGDRFDFWPWEWLGVKCKVAQFNNTTTSTVGLSAIRETVLRKSTEMLVFDKMRLSSLDSDKRLEITCDLTANRLTKTQKLEAKQDLNYQIPSEEESNS